MSPAPLLFAALLQHALELPCGLDVAGVPRRLQPRLVEARVVHRHGVGPDHEGLAPALHVLELGHGVVVGLRPGHERLGHPRVASQRPAGQEPLGRAEGLLAVATRPCGHHHEPLVAVGQGHAVGQPAAVSQAAVEPELALDLDGVHEEGHGRAGPGVAGEVHGVGVVGLVPRAGASGVGREGLHGGLGGVLAEGAPAHGHLARLHAPLVEVVGVEVALAVQEVADAAEARVVGVLHELQP